MATNISRISIHATRQKVWNTLTQASLVKMWQYGSNVQTTWKVGGEIKFLIEWEEKIFEQRGTVLEYNPPQKLRYSLFVPLANLEDRPENYFEMIYTLTAVGEITMLEIAQIDNRPNAVQEEEQGEENAVLQMLKQVAETGQGAVL